MSNPYQDWNADPKPEKKPKKAPKGLKRTPIKYKPRGNTDQLDIMREVFDERGGFCEITGTELTFHPFCVHHILPKGKWERFELYKPNLIVIHPDIHFCYHNHTKDYVLRQWPEAIVIYEKIELLKMEYAKLPTI